MGGVTVRYPEIRHIPNNPPLTGLAAAEQNIVYSTATGADLRLTLLTPWGARERGERLPLIAFIQGSAWTFPDLNYEILQMGWYAQRGYAVAMLTHRNCLEGHPFPAFLEDVKCAIRFLRAHAAEYAIDERRVCAWGTSSGGNAALLLGLTGDDPAYKTNEYPDQSDAVQLVVECFGPTDLSRMLGGSIPAAADDSFGDIFGSLTRGKDVSEVLREMSPVCHVKPGESYPPFLLIHGDADDVVPYEQMELMYRALLESGADARAICVDGAPHEGSFWSRELHGIIQDYISEKL
jgi:acetyl esterase/lipase